jgi:hypothetical protein
VIITVKQIFDLNYVDKPCSVINGLQNVPPEWLKNPFLEDTHVDFSEEIKSHFDIVMFGKLYGADLRPDIMGHVVKKEGAKPELIIVEVKKGDLTLLDVMQARLYELFSIKVYFFCYRQLVFRRKNDAICSTTTYYKM